MNVAPVYLFITPTATKALYSRAMSIKELGSIFADGIRELGRNYGGGGCLGCLVLLPNVCGAVVRVIKSLFVALWEMIAGGQRPE